MGAFDVIVLGGGTAGVHVATEVAGGGKAVALVEAGLTGGESPYLACLPSNSLLLSAARGKTWEDAVTRRDEVTGGLDDSAPARAADPRGRDGDPRHRPDHRPGQGRGDAGPGRRPVSRRDHCVADLLGPGHRDRMRAGRAADRGPLRHTGLDHRAEPVLARPAPAAYRARRRARRMRAHADLCLVRLTGHAGGSGTLAASGRTRVRRRDSRGGTAPGRR